MGWNHQLETFFVGWIFLMFQSFRPSAASWPNRWNSASNSYWGFHIHGLWCQNPLVVKTATAFEAVKTTRFEGTLFEGTWVITSPSPITEFPSKTSGCFQWFFMFTPSGYDPIWAYFSTGWVNHHQLLGKNFPYVSMLLESRFMDLWLMCRPFAWTWCRWRLLGSLNGLKDFIWILDTQMQVN